MVLEALTELQATVATQQNLLVTDYLRREDADVLYAPMDTDGGGTGATTGGLTKTEADTYYAPITDSTVYATQNDLDSKADILYVDTKANADHTHDEYQTKANMVKVGSESTYYSENKVDELLSTKAGTPTHVYAVQAWNDFQLGTWLVPWNNNGVGTFGPYVPYSNDPVQYNNSPLALSAGWWTNSGTKTLMISLTWQATLNLHTGPNEWASTWVALNSNTTRNSFGYQVACDSTTTIAGTPNRSLNSSAIFKLEPTEKFGVYIYARIGIASTSSLTNTGALGAHMQVLCFEL